MLNCDEICQLSFYVLHLVDSIATSFFVLLLFCIDTQEHSNLTYKLFLVSGDSGVSFSLGVSLVKKRQASSIVTPSNLLVVLSTLSRQVEFVPEGYGVATISRLLKITGLFCKRAL